MDLGLNAFEARERIRLHLLYHMCLLLKNDAARKIRVLLLQGDALMAQCSAKIYEENRRAIRVLAQLLSEVDHVENGGQTVPLVGHPREEKISHLGVGL